MERIVKLTLTFIRIFLVCECDVRFATSWMVVCECKIKFYEKILIVKCTFSLFTQKNKAIFQWRPLFGTAWSKEATSQETTQNLEGATCVRIDAVRDREDGCIQFLKANWGWQRSKDVGTVCLKCSGPIFRVVVDPPVIFIATWDKKKIKSYERWPDTSVMATSSPHLHDNIIQDEYFPTFMSSTNTTPSPTTQLWALSFQPSRAANSRHSIAWGWMLNWMDDHEENLVKFSCASSSKTTRSNIETTFSVFYFLSFESLKSRYIVHSISFILSF